MTRQWVETAVGWTYADGDLSARIIEHEDKSTVTVIVGWRGVRATANELATVDEGKAFAEALIAAYLAQIRRALKLKKD